MHWLALQWRPPEAAQATPAEQAAQPAAAPALPAEACAWWALGFTPHVAWVEEALLLEVSACERLWGGRRALLRQVWASQPGDGVLLGAQGATSLVALARLRLKAATPGAAAPADPSSTLPERPADLPLYTLTAARPHLAVLGQLGCRRWGDLAALPRAGLARRFGPALGKALDIALGRAPDAYAWITPPDTFEQALDLPERADTAPALLWSARRLLQALQHWLAARHQGVRALELSWRFDQRRLNGQDLPPQQTVELRTAEPVQAMAHLQRLLAERLARTTMLAPARSLRLRALDTAPWQADTPSFLPEDQPRGDPWHMLVERVSARLGAQHVRMPVPQADHRPEQRQHWQAAEQALRRAPGQAARASSFKRHPTSGNSMNTAAPPARHLPDALSPTWLLRPPQRLAMAHEQPLHRGQPLRLISGPQRVEAGWWDELPPGHPQTTSESATDSADASQWHPPHEEHRPRTSPPRESSETLASREAGERGGPEPSSGRSRGGPISRDYFIAQSVTAELLWVYRERPIRATAAQLCGGKGDEGNRGDVAADTPLPVRWFLHGLYA